mmetsp:Transcript_55059/g.133273  ORF Transcript_55059/g.133273 Transcript_55059/m.133273 type:complete len:274 (+) Transcript_55059:2032-2853(+)
MTPLHSSISSPFGRAGETEKRAAGWPLSSSLATKLTDEPTATTRLAVQSEYAIPDGAAPGRNSNARLHESFPLALCTLTTTSPVPASVGVPDISPVTVSSSIPLGSEPPESSKRRLSRGTPRSKRLGNTWLCTSATRRTGVSKASQRPNGGARSTILKSTLHAPTTSCGSLPQKKRKHALHPVASHARRDRLLFFATTLEKSSASFSSPIMMSAPPRTTPEMTPVASSKDSPGGRLLPFARKYLASGSSSNSDSCHLGNRTTLSLTLSSGASG